MRDCEREILEAYLQLLENTYPMLDRVSHFLERNGITQIDAALRHEREILGHLVTLLTHPDMPYQEKVRKLANAKTHFHRGIFYSYNGAVSILANDVDILYGRYQDEVLPLGELIPESVPSQ